MGSCSACIAKFHKHQPKSIENINLIQVVQADERVKDEPGLKRTYTVGPPIPHVPDHPLADYTFPRSNSANLK
ncbi:hypothetical protein SteCoe_31984 [Stentor coeruleus]|uniref:Uncharacterized protein n=1 Tax=Stentor coeruleus TaxID=5963 RepID=A0A1R2B028_9CILI|nr:hypothetical protein SteCoe_31984 [Stentor coeruleus]